MGSRVHDQVVTLGTRTNNTYLLNVLDEKFHKLYRFGQFTGQSFFGPKISEGKSSFNFTDSQ